MDKNLLEKFNKGKCSDQELQKVLQWLQSDDAESTFSREIEMYWKKEATRKGNSFEGQERVYHKIRALIKQRANSPGQAIPVQRPQRRVGNAFYSYRKMAAIFLMAVISGGIMLWMMHAHLLDNLFYTSQPVSFIEKYSHKGQKITIQLPDGSLVKLNSDSKIKYPQSFSGGNRTVWFEGEGFFKVAKDKNKPFIIISGNVRTTVVGTSFNLKAFPEDDNCEIVVVTGKVLFGKPDQEGVLLNPTQGAVFDKSARSVLKKDTVNLAHVLAWKEGKLVFSNANLEEIIRALENWYGVRFTVNSSKGIVDGYTGTYQDKSLESVLEGIGYVMNFNFEIKGDHITIN